MAPRSRLCLLVMFCVAVCSAAMFAQADSVAGTWAVDPNRGDAPLMGKHPTARRDELVDGAGCILDGHQNRIAARRERHNAESASALVRYGTESGPAATALIASPGQITIPTAGTYLLHVQDDFERLVDNATWASADANIASVTNDGRVTGVGPGTVTITASVGGLSANVATTVVAGSTLPNGTLRWDVAAKPGHEILQVIAGMPDSTGATDYLLERAPSGHTRIKAVGESGHAMWSASLPANPSTFLSGFGNSLGGVILNGDGVLVIGRGGETSWRYPHGTAVAQNVNGAIFVNEGTVLTVLDGATGMVRGRVPMPESRSRASSTECEPGPPSLNVDLETPLGQLKVDAVGNANFLVRATDSYWYRLCTPGDSTSSYHEWSASLELWSISETGTKTSVIVAQDSESGINVASMTLYTGHVVVPTDDGATIVNWQEGRWTASGTDTDEYVVRVTPSGLGTPVTVATSWWEGVVGEDDALFIQTADGVKAVNATTLTTHWTAQSDTIISAVDGGGVAVQVADTFNVLDGAGVVITTAPLSTGGKPTNEGWLYLTSGSVTNKVGPALAWANTEYLMPAGSVLGGSAAPNCTPPNWDVRGDFASRDYKYIFDGVAPAPEFTPDMKASISEAASRWAPAGFPKTIEEGSQASHNVVIRYHTNFPEHAYTILPVDIYSNADVGRIELKATRQFNIPPTLFGLVVNTDMYVKFSSEPTPGFGRRFFTFAVLHEFGHTIGLGHPQRGCGPTKTVMGLTGPGIAENPSIFNNDRFVLFLTDFDKNALKRIYPPQ